eukprot:tig00000144_g9015.t1
MRQPAAPPGGPGAPARADGLVRAAARDRLLADSPAARQLQLRAGPGEQRSGFCAAYVEFSDRLGALRARQFKVFFAIWMTLELLVILGLLALIRNVQELDSITAAIESVALAFWGKARDGRPNAILALGISALAIVRLGILLAISTTFGLWCSVRGEPSRRACRVAAVLALNAAGFLALVPVPRDARVARRIADSFHVWSLVLPAVIEIPSLALLAAALAPGGPPAALLLLISAVQLARGLLAGADALCCGPRMLDCGCPCLGACPFPCCGGCALPGDEFADRDMLGEDTDSEGDGPPPSAGPRTPRGARPAPAPKRPPPRV